MATRTVIGCGVHLADDDLIRVEYVEPHGTIREGYYRVHFGDNATVFLSKQKLDALAFVCKEA